MTSNNNYILFGSTTLADLMQDIYNNSQRRSLQLDSAISDFNKLVESTEDATYLGPIIADYLEIAVKADEQLIKLATVVQRIIAVENKFVESGDILSEEEKRQLRAAAKEQLSTMSEEFKRSGLAPLPSDVITKFGNRK